MVKKTMGQKFRVSRLLIAFSIPLSGIAVLAYQSCIWLERGYWKALGSRLVLDKVLPTYFFQWLHNPHSWLGLNNYISCFQLLPRYVSARVWSGRSSARSQDF